MGIRISEMEEATTFGADDYVPIVTNGTNKKALGQKIKDFIAGFFVSKSGDTMSGDLTVEKSNGDFVSKNPNVTINTSENNGVTSLQTEGFMIKDSANNNITRFISVQYTTGDVTAQISAFNKKTDGTAINNYINATAKKDGTCTYTVADPAAFRSAVGAAAQTQIGSGSLKISEHYTATTSPYGSINISSVIGKSINQCSVFNVLAYSSDYPDGIICFLTFTGTNYYVIVRNTANTIVTNTPVELYVNYYTI